MQGVLKHVPAVVVVVFVDCWWLPDYQYLQNKIPTINYM